MAEHPVTVVGASGRMGLEVRSAVAAHPELYVAGGLEAAGQGGAEIDNGVVVTDDAKAAFALCRVAIDFSIPQATLANLRIAADAGIAYVTGTTGIDAAGREEILAISERIPLIHAPNFSVAVNVLAWLTRQAAEKLGPGYDAELFELHHSAKRDAPSGTALRLAEAVAAGQQVDLEKNVIFERAGDTGARPANAIGIQALRGGDNPGEHTVMFIGRGERLELTHRATTRAHFATGATRAAAWLVDKPPGLYPIERVLGLPD
jgi:4-hydroxy-tetrahydrodipicolinate reductase